jgi:hypothetical protein
MKHMNEKNRVKAPLLKKPAGPSELNEKLGKYWSVMHIGTERSVICEICGTVHPKGNTYTITSFLGFQLVKECCGALIDQIYEEFCEEFSTTFLAAFSEDPTSDKYNLFLYALKEALRDAKKKMAKTSEVIAEISEAAEALGKS